MRRKKSQRACQHFAAHVVEINVHAVGTGSADLITRISRLRVDARRETELIDSVLTFLGRTGYSNCSCSNNPGRLAGCATDGAGWIRHQNGLPRPRLAHVNEARVA